MLTKIIIDNKTYDLKPRNLLKSDNCFENYYGVVSKEYIYKKSIKYYDLYKKYKYKLCNEKLSKHNFFKKFDIIYGSSVIVLIQIIIDRFEILNKINKLEEKKTLVTPVGPGLMIQSKNTQSLFKILETDIWNSCLFTYICKSHFHDIAIKSDDSVFNITTNKAQKNLFYRFLEVSNGNYYFKSLYIGKIPELFLNIFFNKKIGLNKTFTDPYNNSVNNFDVIKSTSFDDVLYKILEILVPKVSVYDNKGYKILFSANSFWADDNYKIKLYNSIVFNKAKHITIQHGGNLGSAKYNTFQWYQEMVSDKLLTWGWGINPKHHIYNFSKNLFSIYKYLPQNNYVTFFNTITPRSGYYIYSFPHSYENVKYIDEVSKLALFFSRKYSIRIRNYPNDLGWNQKKYWKSQNIKISYNSYLEDLYRSKIRIVTFNATTMLECLIINRPTIIFLNMDFFPINESEKPIFNLLSECMVLHYDLKTLKLWLDEISDNYYAWWYSNDVQNAIKIFTKRHANTDSKLSFNKLIKNAT